MANAPVPVSARRTKHGWVVSETGSLFRDSVDAWLVFEQPPSLTLAAKLGSVLIHVEELLSAHSSTFDRSAVEGLLRDAEVRAFLAGIPGVLLPVKRRTP